MNYKIDHLNGGDIIENPTVKKEFSVSVILEDKDGNSFGITVDVKPEDFKDLDGLVDNALKQYEV